MNEGKSRIRAKMGSDVRHCVFRAEYVLLPDIESGLSKAKLSQLRVHGCFTLETEPLNDDDNLYSKRVLA